MRICLKSDEVQSQEMRKALPRCLGWNTFVEAWKQRDLILVSQNKIRVQTQERLFQEHKTLFPDAPVPLLYRPKDNRKENILVGIPGTERKEELILNDVVGCHNRGSQSSYTNFRLACQIRSHSPQFARPHGKSLLLTTYPRWSNLAYLAVSRVEYMHQLERITSPPDGWRVGGEATHRATNP